MQDNWIKDETQMPTDISCTEKVAKFTNRAEETEKMFCMHTNDHANADNIVWLR